MRSASPSSFYGLIALLVLAVCYLVVLFPLNFFAGTSSFWQAQDQDITQYIAGFNAFFHEPWQFPILSIESINTPDGTSVTFVDAIPLYSVLLKLFVPSSFYPFNPFGIWVGLSYLFSVVGAWVLYRQADLKGWIPLFALGVFVLVFPALGARLGHISLMSHWLILFAIALYLMSAKNRHAFWMWTLLLFVAFYINVYIFTMVLAIYVATIVTRLTQSGCFKECLWQLFVPIAIIFSSLWLTLLPLSDGAVSKDFGWGYYSMNILAPIYGGDFIRIQNAEMPGQYEGFNYLGIGVILLLIYGFYLQRKYDPEWVRRHRWVILLFGLFALYALSDKVYLGTVHLFDINYPGVLEPLFEQFRASGRFFWPVGYGLTVFAVVMVARHHPGPAHWLILGAVAIQLADLNQRQKFLKSVAERESEQKIPEQTLNNELNGIQNVYFYPKFRCSGQVALHDTVLPVMLWAATHEKTLNTGYVARFKPNCRDKGHEIKAARSQSAFLFVKQVYPDADWLRLFFPPEKSVRCRDTESLWICTEKESAGKQTVRLPVNDETFSTIKGVFDKGGLKTTQTSETLMYGPYYPMVAGDYKIELLGQASSVEGAVLELVSQGGQKVHATTSLYTASDQTLAKMYVSLEEDISAAELRVQVDRSSELNIHSVILTRLK